MQCGLHEHVGDTSNVTGPAYPVHSSRPGTKPRNFRILIALYYLVPLDLLNSVPLWASLTVGVLALTAMLAHQVRAVFRADYPGIRAAEALATTIPLFLLLFAASYLVLAGDSSVNFNVHTLTRTDSLYFTMTVFSTVGFGDITPTSQTARVMVMVQMILDLIVLGLVVQQLVGAVQVRLSSLG